MATITLPPAAFVLDFASHLVVGKIILCTNSLDQVDDATLGEHWLWVENISRDFALSTSEDCLEKSQDKEASLIVDPIGKNLSNQKLDKYKIILMPDFGKCNLDSLPLRLDSQVYTYTYNDEGDVNKIRLKEWYRKIRGDCVANELGKWSLDRGILVDEPNMWSRRGDLQGATLTSVFVPHETNNYIPAGKSVPTGAMAETVKGIAKALNVTINWKMRNDGEWGAQCPNSTWTGIVGDLAYNKVDFTSTAMWYYPQRALVMDYGLGIFENAITVSLHPDYGTQKGGSLDGKTYWDTFKVGAWILCWSVGLISGVVFALYGTWHDGFANEQFKLGHWRFINGVVEYMACFGGKGISNMDRGPLSLHCFLFYLQLATLGMYITFSSALTAVFTSHGTILEPRSFQDMLDLGIRIVIPDKKIPNPIFQYILPGSAADQVYKDAIRVPALPGEGQASFGRLEDTVGLDPNFRAVLQYANNVNDWKKLRHFQERIINSNALGFPKDSEIKDLFDYQVVKMYNTGLLDKIHHDTMGQGKPPEGRSIVSADEEEIVFEFSKLGFPATLLASGIAIAAVIGLAEKLSILTQAMKLDGLRSSHEASFLTPEYW